MHFKQNITLMSTCLNLCDISADPLFYRKSSVNHSNRSGSSSSSSNNSVDTRTRNSKSSKKFQRLKLENVLLGPVPVEIKKHSESFPGNFHSLSPDQVSMSPNIFVLNHWQKARSFLLSVNGLAFLELLSYNLMMMKLMFQISNESYVSDPVFYYIKSSSDCPCAYHDQVYI